MSETDKRSLSGKVALVTGASSGLGAATAIEFARRGALLSLTGRNTEKLEEVAEECKNVSPEQHEPLITAGDVTDEADMEKVFLATIETFEHLDILVNNAGIMGAFSTIEDTTMSDYDQVFNVNVRAPFHMTKLAIPELEKSKGCIINVSAACSVLSWTMGTAYAMSKCAVDHFTRCAANALGPRGIRVNAVNPGAVPTQLLRGKGIDDEVADQLLSHSESSAPLRTMGTPEDIAYAIAFLASDEAAFITGAILFADGGLTIAS